MSARDTLKPAAKELLAAAEEKTLAALGKRAEDQPLSIDERRDMERRLRDYRSWERLDEASPEAIDLAATLARQRPEELGAMDANEIEQFRKAVNAMLIAVYQRFLRQQG